MNVVVAVNVNELKCIQHKRKKYIHINPNTVTCDHGANIIIGREA